MKKSIILSIAAAAAFATAAFTANTVSADETPATDTTAKTPTTTQDTTATVNLKAGTNSNDNSAIELTKAPSYVFDATFGKDGGSVTSKATGDSTVTVENPGIAATWTVSTKTSLFTGIGDTTGTLSGAVLTLPATSATGSDKNTISTDALKLTDSALPFASSSIKDGNFTGIGTLAFDTDKQEASLYIPAGNVAGSYQANLTWTLSQTPTAE